MQQRIIVVKRPEAEESIYGALADSVRRLMGKSQETPEIIGVASIADVFFLLSGHANEKTTVVVPITIPNVVAGTRLETRFSKVTLIYVGDIGPQGREGKVDDGRTYFIPHNSLSTYEAVIRDGAPEATT